LNREPRLHSQGSDSNDLVQKTCYTQIVPLPVEGYPLAAQNHARLARTVAQALRATFFEMDDDLPGVARGTSLDLGSWIVLRAEMVLLAFGEHRISCFLLSL
jgi:hypothetical protein